MPEKIIDERGELRGYELEYNRGLLSRVSLQERRSNTKLAGRLCNFYTIPFALYSMRLLRILAMTYFSSTYLSDL